MLLKNNSICRTEKTKYTTVNVVKNPTLPTYGEQPGSIFFWI